MNPKKTSNRASVHKLVTGARTLLLLTMLVVGVETRAQSGNRKIEAGAQFVFLSVHSPDLPRGFFNDIDDEVFGGGVRFGYNFTKRWAAEAEVNVFQRAPTDDPATRGKWVQGLFGVKATRRQNGTGLFLKARPGFMRFDGVAALLTAGDGSQFIGLILDNTYFALDLGGGIELYPSPRTLVRIEAGDLMIRYTNRPPSNFDPISNSARVARLDHNFQFAVGFGWRF
jgi:hypothetical protein